MHTSPDRTHRTIRLQSNRFPPCRNSGEPYWVVAVKRHLQGLHPDAHRPPVAERQNLQASGRQCLRCILNCGHIWGGSSVLRTDASGMPASRSFATPPAPPEPALPPAPPAPPAPRYRLHRQHPRYRLHRQHPRYRLPSRVTCTANPRYRLHPRYRRTSAANSAGPSPGLPPSPPAPPIRG